MTRLRPAGPLDASLDQLDAELCERKLSYFIRHFWSETDPAPYIHGWHIDAVCEHLEAVAYGQIPRLIINVPPRTMKSLACSVAWPAWIWAKQPPPGAARAEFPLLGSQVKFMSVSYAHNLSLDHNRVCRDLIQSKRYQYYWGDRVTLSKDQNAKWRYDTLARGQRLATSVEGMATGMGGDIILVDDPLDPASADSPVERQTVIDWWTGTMQTRLNDARTGAIVIIMQRVHEEDLTGHVLAHETGWTHLCLPARYEPDHPYVYARDPRREDGDLLWPEKLPAEELDRRESNMGSYRVAGQHQQRPAPREGGMFSRAGLPIVKAAPAGGLECRGWDFAGTTKKDSPWTVGLKMKRVREQFFITDVERFRGTPLEVERSLQRVTEEDGRHVIVDYPQDPGQAGKAQAQGFARKLAGFKVHFSPETGSKVVRAEAFSAQSEAGNVFLVAGAWNDNLRGEYELFPNSTFADQVDAGSRAFARLVRRNRRTLGGGAVLISGV